MPNEGARSREVEVMGKTCTVWTVKTGKVTWLAYGDFDGKRIEATSYSSEHDALTNWRQAARNEAIW